MENNNIPKTTGGRTGLSRVIGVSAAEFCKIKNRRVRGKRLSHVRKDKEITGKRLSQVRTKNIAVSVKKLSSIRPIGKIISGKELTPFWKKVMIMTEN